MEQKTKVHAEEGRQELIITREFDLPADLVFRAHTEAEIVAQWMGTKVLKLESEQHGSFHFETTDPMGNVHGFNGTIHSIKPDQKIIRTFEMENTPFETWLEYLDFEPLTDDTSKLTMHVIYRSVALRDQLLQMPFAQGINYAHNRLESAIKTLNNL